MKNIYLSAIRRKLRFSSDQVFPGTNQAPMSTEQLMDIPLDAKSRISINSLYIETAAKLEDSQTSGLVTKPTKVNEELSLKLAILKDIFEIRTAEQDAIKNANAKAVKRQKIIDALADAEDNEFKGKTKEEYRKMLEDLDK